MPLKGSKAWKWQIYFVLKLFKTQLGRSDDRRNYSMSILDARLVATMAANCKCPNVPLSQIAQDKKMNFVRTWEARSECLYPGAPSSWRDTGSRALRCIVLWATLVHHFSSPASFITILHHYQPHIHHLFSPFRETLTNSRYPITFPLLFERTHQSSSWKWPAAAMLMVSPNFLISYSCDQHGCCRISLH